MTNRRSYDPFAPHKDDEDQPVEDVGDGLETLKKDELIDLAAAKGVAIYGTKSDIIERLRAQ